MKLNANMNALINEHITHLRHQDVGFRRSIWALHLLLLICAWDLSAVDIGTVNLRLAWLLLPAVALIVPRGKYHPGVFWFSILFFLVHFVAAIASASPLRGIVYSSWILFSYAFFFQLSARAAERLGIHVWQVIRVNGRLQILGAFLLFAFGWHDRAHFVYYEPSYMAIGLIPYVAVSFFYPGRRWLDMAFLSLFLFASQSGNFAIVLIIVAACWLYSVRKSSFFGPVLAGIFVMALVVGVYVLSNKSSINYQVISEIYAHGLSLEAIQALIERGGNRIPRLEVAWKVFLENPILGVGPGNYIDHISGRDFSSVTDGLPWLDPQGRPATNILIEAAANAGIFASLLMLFSFFKLFRKSLIIQSPVVRNIVVSVLIAAACMMQFDSNYLRAYLWVALGVCAIQSMKLHLLSRHRGFLADANNH